jgi:TRAP-type transport system periplasmic protein
MRVSLKVITIALALVLLIGLFGCSTQGPAVETPKTETGTGTGDKPIDMKPVNISLSHMWPAVHPIETELALKWKQAIEEATDGLITVTTYPGATLVGGADTYEGVEAGIADVGLSVFGYTPGRFPLMQALELPGVVYNNGIVSSYVTWEAIKQFDLEEVKDTKMLMAFGTGPGHLYTKDPIRTLEDIQGKEMRAFGMTVETLEALGAVPVAMPQSDVYEALSRGVVKGTLAPLEVLEGWRQAEVTDYITMTPFLYNATFFFNMNLDVWESFPPEIQKIVDEVSEKIFEEVCAGLFEIMNESALKFAVEQTGQEIIELSPQEFERWKNQVMPIQQKYVDKMNAQGLPGREFLDLIISLSEKYNNIYK